MSVYTICIPRALYYPWLVPWTARRSNRSISEGDQPWDLFGRNDAKAETPVLWPPHAKSWLVGKDPDAGRDWGQEEKGTTWCDGWMASPARWMWVWVNPGSWWWTERPGLLRFMGLQKVGHDWAIELNWTDEFKCRPQSGHYWAIESSSVDG